MQNQTNYKYPKQFASHHRLDILNSKVCSCFHCLEQFPPSKIQEWIDEDENRVGQTALCPFCNIDAVIGDKSIVMTEKLLQDMQKYWFN